MALPNPFAWHTASAICFPPTVFDGAISLLRAWDGGGIYRLRPRTATERGRSLYIPPPSQARKREMAPSKTVGGKHIADAVCQAKGLGRAMGAQTRCRGGPPWL